MERLLKPNDKVYDIGCGDKPFAGFLLGNGVSHVGIDMMNGFYGEDKVDVFGEADAIPVADRTADAVLHSQVIEHLPDPEKGLEEAGRILKSEGLLFISFPFLYPLHAAPHDFFRYSGFGFEAMAKRHGFEILEEHSIGGFWYTASVLLVIYCSVFDRSIFKGVEFGPVLTLPLQWFFWLLHKAEGAAYRVFGKTASGSRRRWTVNYVIVARKKAD